MSTTPLLAQKCRPLPAGTPPLSPDEIATLLRLVPGWALAGSTIEKSYRFGNYYETIAFVNAIALVAHREDHHPDLSVGYNACRVAFSTHSTGGISMNDFICAAKIEALASM